MDTSMAIGSLAGAGFSSTVNLRAGNAKAEETERKFSALVDSIQAGMDTKKASAVSRQTAPSESLASSRIIADSRLPGDYIQSFHDDKATAADHAARPTGAAANSGQKGKIDKTSKLYEQALELESYFVKMMLSSMRDTVQKSGLTGKDDFAGKMYDDMLYDELARDMTKSAGFGLADQVYLQLEGKS